MGLVGSLVWVNSYRKKQCRSLFSRMRAAVKKAVRNGNGKHQFKFQYDPSSYALNFDDGWCSLGERERAFRNGKPLDRSKPSTWVYVIWVENSECCSLSLAHCS